MELNLKYDIVEKASKMTNINLNKKIDELMVMILEEDLTEEAKQEAREIASVYANVLNRRGNDNSTRKSNVACTGGCCSGKDV